MEILLQVHNYSYTGGGTFFRAFNLGKNLAKFGHKVTILATSENNWVSITKNKKHNLTLIETPGILPPSWRYGYDVYDLFRRLQIVKTLSIDVVYAFENRPVVIYPALTAKKTGSKLIMDWSDWFGKGGSVEERSNPVARFILRPIETFYEENYRNQADATTVISHTLKERAEGLGLNSKNIHILYNGVNTQQFYPVSKAVARKQVDYSLQSPIIGYLGSLFLADSNLMLAAYKKIRKEFPKVRLIILGNPKVKIPNLEGVIKTGFVTDEILNFYLNACDILWLPLSDTLANRARWPSKITTYFSVGRPTIACSVGDVPDIINKHNIGINTSPNSDAFAEATLSLLNDSNKQDLLGNEARLVAVRYFDWNIIAGQVERIIQNLS